MIVAIIPASRVLAHPIRDLRVVSYDPSAAIAKAELELAQHARTIARLRTRQRNLRALVTRLKEQP